MDEQVVYWIGFFVALAFVVFGADDVLWDVFALFAARQAREAVAHQRSRRCWPWSSPPGTRTPCWAAGTTSWPPRSTRAWLGSFASAGVYPNDAAAIVAVARALEARHGGTVVLPRRGDDPDLRQGCRSPCAYRARPSGNMRPIARCRVLRERFPSPSTTPRRTTWCASQRVQDDERAWPIDDYDASSSRVPAYAAAAAVLLGR